MQGEPGEETDGLLPSFPESRNADFDMKIRLLASHVSDPSRLQPLTTFLINDVVAIDGGSLGHALTLEEQRRVRRVIVTHTHSDHVATLPIFLAEVFPFLNQPMEIYSTRESIGCLRTHIFNDKIWPDFERIRLFDGKGASLRYTEIEHLLPFEVEGLRVTPIWTNHTVPTTGLAIEDEEAAILFTADTYHTEEIWQVANRLKNLRAIFVDVSYPNRMEKLANDSKHLTPGGLAIELRKLHKTVQVFPVHLKPQFRDQILEELRALEQPDIAAGEINREYVF